MTLKKSMAIAQLVEQVITQGQVIAVKLGDLDVSGQTTELIPQVFIANSACYVKSAKLVSALALAANDTNYVTITIKNVTQTTEMAATAKTTKATGGEAVSQYTPWTVTIDQNNDLAAGDVLQLSVTPASASVANDLTDVLLVLEISFDDAEAL